MAAGLPLSNERPPVFLPDLIQADKTRKASHIFDYVLEYLRERPNENFATLEQWFRDNNCYTHLIAKEIDPNHSFNPPTFRGQPCEFELFISTHPEKQAWAEVRKYAHNQDLNLSRLSSAGNYTIKHLKDLERTTDAVGGEMYITAQGAEAIRRGIIK